MDLKVGIWGLRMENKLSVAEMLNGIRDHWVDTATPETEVMLGLIRLNDIVAANTQKALAPHGLTPAAFEVLVTLRALPPPRQMTPTALYRSILITSGGMTKILKTLEEQGAVVRADNGRDGRSRLVKLTPKGKVLVEKSMRAVMRADRALLGGSLSAPDIEQLRKTLLKALAHLESGGNECPD